jgi:phosphatidylglycerophosphate synthase
MWWTVALGAFLVHVQSVLDGCDGELARLKFQSSRFGEWLDNVLDDTMNIAYGLALGHASAVLFDMPLFRWLGLGTAIGYAIYNAVLYAHLWLVFRRGNPFLFRWWFQRDDAYIQDALGGPVGVVHALGRRDTFLFAFFVLCLLRLPQVATVWYFAIAAISGGLAIAHVLAGGIRRSQAHQRSAASTRSA